YVNPSTLRILFRFQSGSIVAWTLLLVCCLLVRRRYTRAPVLIVLATVIVTYELGYIAYFFGLHTNPLYTLVLTTCWVGALVVFGRQAIVSAAFACHWLILLGVTFAEQAGWIAYAPLYSDSPIQSGHLHTSWLVGSGITLFLMLSVQLVIYVVIARWHD